MKIVRAGASHLELLAPLFGAYRRFYEQKADPVAEGDYLAERLETEEAAVFLAMDSTASDRAVGFVLLYPGFDSVSLISTWTLHDLYVDHGHRRRGVGRRLMNRAAQFCRSTGAARIDLATAITNTTAQPLYESLGYERDRDFYYYSLALRTD